jgi:uroporphyrinogen III methyltransferase/synthase
MVGKVYLVGAGPGDPKLITIRGLEALRKSDAVVYDRLASPRLLAEAKPGADKIYVGKLPDRHTMPQDEINRLLVELAAQGKTVTRLKGGDPSVFGRVGEEAEALAAAGIPFEIVPGVTSAIAVPAYAGIPVTHRDYSSSFTVVTGHEKPEKLDSTVDWEKLARTDTIIFLMGVSRIELIARRLVEHGRAADTPVALVRWGTLPEQATLTGTLADIADRVRAADFQPPAVIVVGRVVRLRERLAWFERKPLFGRRILVTRTRAQASELAERIDELGGEPVLFPVMEMRPPQDPAVLEQLDRVLGRLDTYDWIVFTSANGVDHFFQRLRERRIDIRTMHRSRIAAVGPKTRELLEERGLTAEALPAGDYRAEGLLEALRPILQPGARILLAKGDLARSVLPDTLRAWGMDVEEIVTYENVPAKADASEIVDLLEQGMIHYIPFTSSSAVRRLFDAIAACGKEPLAVLARARIASIGPLTTGTARELGLTVHVTAGESTIASLLDAIVEDSRRGADRTGGLDQS